MRKLRTRAHLVCLGEAQLPGTPRVLDGAHGAGTRAPVKARHLHRVNTGAHEQGLRALSVHPSALLKGRLLWQSPSQ